MTEKLRVAGNELRARARDRLGVKLDSCGKSPVFKGIG
jgi:hypothetical protein